MTVLDLPQHATRRWLLAALVPVALLLTALADVLLFHTLSGLLTAALGVALFALAWHSLTAARSTSAYDAIPLPTVTVNRHGVVRQANHAAMRTLARGPQQLGGRHVHELFHDRAVSQGQCIVCRHLARHEPLRSYALYFPRRDAWYEFSLTRLDRRRAAAGMVHTCQDITARKQAELAARHSDKKYHRLMEAYRNELFFFQHDRAGVFSYLSPSVSEVLGYTPDQCINHYDRFLTDHPCNRDARRLGRVVLRGETPPRLRVEVRHHSGACRFLEVCAFPVKDRHGEVIAIEGFARDVTRQMLTEQRLHELFDDVAEPVGERNGSHAIAVSPRARSAGEAFSRVARP